MKWIALIFGIVLIIAAWLIVQVGKGVLFTHSGFEEWDDTFLAAYSDCCLMTDLRTAAPLGLLGLAMLSFAAWKFVRS
ncbi:hypothetical protein RA27_18235 [Ruegeria sp. ANG-R]|nr:hypothetical protein RA27_18235 [Ruegeria sp. ANG-R]